MIRISFRSAAAQKGKALTSFDLNRDDSKPIDAKIASGRLS